MYYLGIDISKFKHDCAVIDSDGDVVTSAWSFNNDSDGFAALKDLIDTLNDEIRIGFESTSHYGLNLKLFLEKNDYSFMEFNPVLIKKFINGKSLRKTKTDSLDAISIARFLKTVEYKPYPKSFYHLDALKSLTRFRYSLVRQRSKQLIELTNNLDKMFPEFKPFFGGKLGHTAMYILNNFSSPEKISRMNTQSYDRIRKISKGKFSAEKFATLKYLAKNTIGHFTDYLEDELHVLLSLYEHIDSNIVEIEKRIESLIMEINPPLLSIPGIGFISAAVILSEYGDISRFKSPAAMLSFAGMEPSYFQSGTTEAAGHMVKHGSSYLRYTLGNCCLPLIRFEPVFAEYYAKKRAEGKPYRVAMTHVAKKLVRVIYVLQTKNILYDSAAIR